MAPIVATVRQERPQVLDGFTRWEAAHQVRGMTTLLVRLVELDDQRAKAAIFGLNQTGRRPYELEEAWLVQALVREDGLDRLHRAFGLVLDRIRVVVFVQLVRVLVIERRGRRTRDEQEIPGAHRRRHGGFDGY